MTIYAVLTPRGEPSSAAAGATFVPDHFSFAAFFLGPLWLARHRVWRGLIGYATVLVLVIWARRWLQLPPETVALVIPLLALYLGFEGQALRRAALERRGYHLADVVAAHDRAHAEESFFGRGAGAGQALQPASPVQLRGSIAHVATDVLGSMPQPGGRR